LDVIKPQDLWPIDELNRRVVRALEGRVDKRVTGRLRERTIRFYTTLGLIDRPAAMDGRTALYGRRHLLQLVAIKRLQADGFALEKIQERLVGLTNAKLEAIARLPEAERPALLQQPGIEPHGRARPANRFWAAMPASPDAELSEGHDALSRGMVAQPELRSAAARIAEPLIQGVRVAEGLTVLISAVRPLTVEDVKAIRVASKPLEVLLRTRGLLLPERTR